MGSPAINAPSYVRVSSGAPPNKDCRVAPRNAWQAIRKGLRGCCPNCGEGKMFCSYLKVNDACPHCGEELFHQRADDAPPYMTIFVVGHIIGTFMILVEEYWPDAPIWLHAMVWPTITLILSLWLLPIMAVMLAFDERTLERFREMRGNSKPFAVPLFCMGGCTTCFSQA